MPGEHKPHSANLVEQLRERARYEDDPLDTAAADEIERLTAEVDDLRDTLVFADGACVSGHGMALADLYWSESKLALLERAGCWAKGAARRV